MITPDFDAAADGFALIAAHHNGEADDAELILRYCDKDAVLSFLTALADDLITSLSKWNGMAAPEALTSIRTHNLRKASGPG